MFKHCDLNSMDALRLEQVSKQYKDFQLKDISLTLPMGSIMGVIGENGAGKTTAIKALLGLIQKDTGRIWILGKEFNNADMKVKEYIGVVMDNICFSRELNARHISKIMRNTYKSWSESKFQMWLQKFQLDERKMIKDYSKGMTMKLSLAVAMSHDTRILILDEATSGLDPIVRSQVLEIFLEFVKDGEHSVLVSSHIISDLEKICDYIAFIHGGEICISASKEELLNKYGILKCSKEQFEQVDKEFIVNYKEYSSNVEALVERKKISKEMKIGDASIEEIMVHYVESWR